MKKLFGLVKETFSEWGEDKASRLAAALSYYTLFSLAPLLIITISLLGLFLGDEAARGQIYQQMDNLVGNDAALAIQEMVAAAGEQERAGIIATVIGLVTLLFGALGVFGQLYDSLNTIWEVEPIMTRKGIGMIFEMAKRKLLPFTMLLGIGFLLLVSLVVSAALAALDQLAASALPLPPLLLQLVNAAASIGLIAVMFAALYKYVPEANIAWKDALLGGLATALLFVIGKQLIGMYLGRPGTASTFGAAGSLVLVMLWVYYSAQIFFLGAEFTQVYAREYGSGVEPEADAIAVPDMTQVREEAIRAAKEGRDPKSSARERVLGQPVSAFQEARQSRHEGAVVVRAERRRNIGPFAAAFIAFWTFVGGILMGMIRSEREREA